MYVIVHDVYRCIHCTVQTYVHTVQMYILLHMTVTNCLLFYTSEVACTHMPVSANYLANMELSI